MARMGENAEAFGPAPAGRAMLRRIAWGAGSGCRALADSARRGVPRQRLRRAEAAARGAGEVVRREIRIELERGILFLTVPIWLGLGALLYFNLPAEPNVSWLAGAMAAVAGCVVLSRGKYGLHLACWALCLCLVGFGAGKLETWRASTMMLGQEVTTRVTGRVVRVDRLSPSRARLVIDVTETARPKLRYAPERVRLTGKLMPGMAAGATVSGLARLAPPAGPAMPGGYDFGFRSYFDGLGANGFFLGAPTVIETTAAGGFNLSDRIEAVRDAIAARIRAKIGGAEGEVAAALIVGVRGGIPEEVNEALRSTGLAHILSISGVHMALVAASVIGSIRGLFALFPVFSSRRAVKKYAAAAGLTAVSVYVLFSGADVAALRSYVMLAVMLAAMTFDRAALSMRNLAIAAILILLWSPHEIMGPSFQMSFAATAALVACYAAWSERPRHPHPRSWSQGFVHATAAGATHFVSALAATSIVAGAATAVFGIYHFQRFAPLSLPANLVVMPIVSILVMPFAILGMLAMTVGAEGPFLAVMGFGLRLMNKIATWFSGHSPIDAVGSIPVATLLLTAASLAIFAVTTTRLRLVAPPVLLAGLAALPLTRQPTVFVSENAKLVGVVAEPGSLAVTAARGGGFTLQSWERAAAAPATRPNSGGPGASFNCTEEVCTLGLPDGRSIATVFTSDAAARACAAADLLVFNAPGRPRTCGKKKRGGVIITRKELAMRGAATVDFPAGGNMRPRVVHALANADRPWQAHRKFSRAARGLDERAGTKLSRTGHSGPVEKVGLPSIEGQAELQDKHLRNTE